MILWNKKNIVDLENRQIRYILFLDLLEYYSLRDTDIGGIFVV